MYLIRATCEQEPNYLQTFTSHRRLRFRQPHSTLLGMKTLTTQCYLRTELSCRQTNKTKVLTGLELSAAVTNGASLLGGGVHLKSSYLGG